MKTKLNSFVLAIILIVTTNNYAQKNGKKNNRWFVEKELSNNNPVNPNPELGGKDFLKIHKNKTADFKVGDIVEQMTWKMKGKNLLLTNTLTAKTMVFKVGKNTLVDKYGTKWFENKPKVVTNWFVNKEFSNNKPVNPNPELGGRDFLKINDNNTADFKVGDMVQQMTWEVKGKKLVLTNKLTERKHQFKIGKDFLLDEFGTKWTTK